MADISKLSPDDGSTILNIKDSNAVHWVDNAILGAKNIAKPVKAGQTVNTNNVEYVCGTDGTVTVTGTATGDTGVYTNAFTTDSTKSYKITGCPSGGSNSTYYMRIGIRANAGDNWGTWFADEKGTGVTIPANTSAPYGFVITCRVMNGTAGGGKVFKPMVRLASDTDDTYVSYAMTNRELTTSKADDVCATGSHSIQLIVSAITPTSGQPEFFIPWNNPLKKAITFDNFKIYNRTSSGWVELTQASAPSIGSSDLKENGFYCYANLNTALTANSTFAFRLTGNIVFS